MKRPVAKDNAKKKKQRGVQYREGTKYKRASWGDLLRKKKGSLNIGPDQLDGGTGGRTLHENLDGSKPTPDVY